MRFRALRFVGIFVTLIVVSGLIWLVRSRPSPQGSPGQAEARRGGQLVVSVRSEPRSFNRLTVGSQSTELLSLLTQARLVRVNKATFELEPWLAERWDSSPDGLTHTLHLRRGVQWSDGAPFTSADVAFSLQAAMDPEAGSVLTSVLVAGGQPITVATPNPETVTLTFAAPSGPGLRMLDQVTILPKHKLEAAYAKGEFAKAWGAATPPAEIVGLGPFVLKEYTPGQRLVFDRNPNYWRKAPNGDGLPYLDRVILEIVPDQNAELLRLQSGATDLSQDALRPDDYVPVKRLEQQGTLTMQEIGVATDADALWFCLKPEARKKDPRWAFVQRREFRQALSHAVDREEFAHTVFLGEAVPIWGPVTPGNKAWFSPNLPRYPYDEAKAKALLKSIGLEDRDGNGVVEDAKGTEARFTVLTQKGLTLVRARHRGGPRRGGQGGRGARRGAPRVRDDGAAAADVRLRRHLHARAGHRHGPGRQHGLLGQFRRRASLEHRVEGAGHRVGGAHRCADAGAGGHDRHGQAPRHLQSGADDRGREPAADPLRGAAALRGALHARAGGAAVGDAPAPAVERGHAQRVEPAAAR